jgi:DNA-binding response OmpR family regulator
VLRQLRAGAFAPEAKPDLRTLWMSPNGELEDVLRGFEAGADDVLRAPFAYTELRARAQALMRRDLIEPCAAPQHEAGLGKAGRSDHQAPIHPNAG